MVSGIRWRGRTGVPWRDMPSECGTWQTVAAPTEAVGSCLNVSASWWRGDTVRPVADGYLGGSRHAGDCGAQCADRLPYVCGQRCGR
ncbi:transposase [Streptomyces sp. NPDC015171]|uniref:transposase n=1 Tax=Streptomyces sp. NPDC015171 TaxID=3364945 RepID=UPI0036FFA084